MSWWTILVAALTVLALLGVGGVVALRREPRLRLLLEEIEELGWRRGARAVWALARDPRVPIAVRLIPLPLLLYLVFPIDLIPDFIPVLGQLDDILVVALAMYLVVRLTPWPVLREHFDVGDAAADH